LALPFVAVAAHAEDAQDFPSRTVRLVVPAAPGGPIDAVARISRRTQTAWPAAVVIENRAGAGTSTGAAFVAAAASDGIRSCGMPDSITVNPHLYPNVNPDPLKSSSRLPSSPPHAASRRAVPASALRISVGSLTTPGAGARLSIWRRRHGDVEPSHGVLLEQRTGVATTHIPFKERRPP